MEDRGSVDGKVVNWCGVAKAVTCESANSRSGDCWPRKRKCASQDSGGLSFSTLSTYYVISSLDNDQGNVVASVG